MGPFARDARGEGISPVLMAVLGGGHKLLCSCHSESHPSASDTALCIRPVPLQQLHPPAAEPASPHPIHPFALDPSLRTNAILLPWTRPPPSDPVPNRDCLSVSPHHPPQGGGRALGTSLGDLPPSLCPLHPVEPHSCL